MFLNVTGVDDREVVAMVEAGACPDANLLGNWVTVRTRLDADAADPDQDFFGAFAYDVDAAVANLPARYALAGSYASLGDVELENGDCTDGILLVDDAAMYMTAGGGALVVVVCVGKPVQGSGDPIVKLTEGPHLPERLR